MVSFGEMLYSRPTEHSANFSSTRHSLWTSLHPAEVFALAIAVVSLIQAVIFIGVQSTTVDSTFATGCAAAAQLMWPGKMIQPYPLLQLI